MAEQLTLALIPERPSFPPQNCVDTFGENQLMLYTYGPIFGFDPAYSSLFYPLSNRTFCPNYWGFIYILISGNAIQTFLLLQGLFQVFLNFHQTYIISFSTSTKKPCQQLCWACVEFMDSFGTIYILTYGILCYSLLCRSCLVFFFFLQRNVYLV